MKFVVFALLVVAAFAAPYDKKSAKSAAATKSDSAEVEVVPILRDDRFHPEDGVYSFDVETGDGIIRKESGSRIEHADGAVGSAGEYSFTLPDGQLFELKFVADENGFQPESSFLPVAPEFPHEIPEFVLEQIEKARKEDEEEAKAAKSAVKSDKAYAKEY